MDATSISTVVDEQLAIARKAPAGRAASTVSGGHDRVMRQTVIALTEGSELHEHENPGEATLYTLAGEVEVHSDGEYWPVRTGELFELPPARHSVRAVADAAILLTAVPLSRDARTSSGPK